MCTSSALIMSTSFLRAWIAGLKNWSKPRGRSDKRHRRRGRTQREVAGHDIAPAPLVVAVKHRPGDAAAQPGEG